MNPGKRGIEEFINEPVADALYSLIAPAFPKGVYMFVVNFAPGPTPDDSDVSVLGIRPGKSPMLQALEETGVDVKGAYDRHQKEIGDLLSGIFTEALADRLQQMANDLEKEESEEDQEPEENRNDEPTGTEFVCMTCARRRARIMSVPNQDFLDLDRGVCRIYKYPCLRCAAYVPDKELEIIQMEDVPDEPEEAQE